MAKGDKFYFENFCQCAALSKKAADYLVNCLENYDPDKIETMLAEMHDIEHSADIKRHEMGDALAKAFVTPVDREDLDMLSHNLDNVTDKIEDVVQRLYVNNITKIPIKNRDFSLLFFCEATAKKRYAFLGNGQHSVCCLS